MLNCEAKFTTQKVHSPCKLLYTGWIDNKVRLYSTGNCIEYPVIKHNGKEQKKSVYRYICVTESVCCIAEMNTSL